MLQWPKPSPPPSASGCAPLANPGAANNGMLAAVSPKSFCTRPFDQILTIEVREVKRLGPMLMIAGKYFAGRDHRHRDLSLYAREPGFAIAGCGVISAAGNGVSVCTPRCATTPATFVPTNASPAPASNPTSLARHRLNLLTILHQLASIALSEAIADAGRARHPCAPGSC